MCSISIFGHTPSSPSPDPSCLAGIVALAALAALVPNFWLFYFSDVGAQYASLHVSEGLQIEEDNRGVLGQARTTLHEQAK